MDLTRKAPNARYARDSRPLLGGKPMCDLTPFISRFRNELILELDIPWCEELGNTIKSCDRQAVLDSGDQTKSGFQVAIFGGKTKHLRHSAEINRGFLRLK